MSNALNEFDHPRDFRGNAYVYPVLSRRAGGISVGINLSPGKALHLRLPLLPGGPQPSRRCRSVTPSICPGSCGNWSEVLGGPGAGRRAVARAEFAALPAEKKRVRGHGFQRRWRADHVSRLLRGGRAVCFREGAFWAWSLPAPRWC